MSCSKFEPGTVVCITENCIEATKQTIPDWFKDKEWVEFIKDNVGKPWVIEKVIEWFNGVDYIYSFTNCEEGKWALPYTLFESAYQGNDECSSIAAINSLFGGI